VPCGGSTLLFIAGQVAAVAEQETLNEFRRQVKCCYEQMRTIIEAAGGRLGDLVQTTAYLTDIARLRELASGRADFVGQTPPVSTVVEVAWLARPDLMIEIDGVAVLSQT
jgi:enamine deaminase RidA (YjgF/YER057c/UK114 family)